MGCPQSKSKTKDVSSGNDDNGHVAKTRTTKPPLDYNDDPVLRGGFDDIFIPDVDLDNEANGQKSENSSVKQDTAEMPQKADGVSNEELADSTESEKSRENVAKSKETENAAKSTETENVAKSTETQNAAKSKKKVPDTNLQSVFIPDETFDSNENISAAATSSDHAVFDVNDVSIGQAAVFEVNNPVVNMQGETVQTPSEFQAPSKMKESNDDEKKQTDGRVDSAKSEEETEKRHSESDSQYVRYQNRDKVEYGLPEGVPGPAPPKLKKADIVKPNAFTIADKIVDQAPATGVVSMDKLASYLSGVSKKEELLATTDDDDESKKNIPPLVPVKTKKTDIVKDVNMFKKIDDNARNIPDSVRLSVDKLVAHLCKGATSDLEKVRAFYYWICHNISYFYDGDQDYTKRLRFDAVSTLRQGKGSYVNLMSAFCKEVSIPVVTIPGCSKGLGHQPDKEFEFGERNHSWNAVYINGEWRFLDCTWGAGFLDINKKFHPQFDEFWFLTDPEVFAYDHFPSHPTWQLLDEPIDIDEFNKTPSLTERSRELGFKPISHREPIIYVQNEVTVSFGTETYPLSNITADFRATDGVEVNSHRCMRRIDEKTFEVRLVPPQTGQYSLLLYGKAKDYRHAKYRKLMEYTLRVDMVYPQKVVFPNHVKAWGPEPNYAEYGFANSIEKLSVFKTDTNEMSISLEQTRKNVISPELKATTDLDKELEDYTMITADERGPIVHCRFPTSGNYRLDIYAIGSKTEKLEYCASFLIECTVSDKPPMYPKYNGDSVSKQACELLEPLDRELPSETVVTFRLRSAGLRQAMVGIPTQENYGSRIISLGELKVTDNVFSGQVKTPKKGQAVLLSGSAAPPNVFWSRVYEFVTV